MTKPPLISVLLPVYNAEAFLDRAIQSILNQTLKDYEFIILDDGSIDMSGTILEKYKKIAQIYYLQHQPLYKVLNFGIEIAQGKYIARMDADDIAYPDRFYKQISLLESNMNIGIVGGDVLLIDACERVYGRLGLQNKPLVIQWEKLVRNPFIHPTVMIRASLLREHNLCYQSFPYAEDYGLWSLILQFSNGFNLSEPLLMYRIHGKNVSLSHQQMQFYNHCQISFKTIINEFPSYRISMGDVENLVKVMFANLYEYPWLKDERRSACQVYLKILDMFCQKYYGQQEIQDVKKLAVSRLVYWLLFPPIPEGWRDIYNEICRVDKNWIEVIIRRLPSLLRSLRQKDKLWNIPK